jgi:hypothetical protein
MPRCQAPSQQPGLSLPRALEGQHGGDNRPEYGGIRGQYLRWAIHAAGKEQPVLRVPEVAHLAATFRMTQCDRFPS